MVVQGKRKAKMLSGAGVAPTPTKRVRSKDAIEQQMADMGEDNIAAAREELDSLLDDKPHIVWHVLMFVKRGRFNDMADGKENNVTRSHWHGTQVRMQVIPKYWLEAYMTDLEPKLELVWDDILAAGPTTSRELFYMAHSISGSTLLPTKAHEKTLFADMLRRRYRECGERLKDCTLWPTTIKDFSWKAPPLYQIIEEAGKVASVKHISGALYHFPAEGRVPSNGTWVNPHSDS